MARSAPKTAHSAAGRCISSADPTPGAPLGSGWR